jgi:predicted dehydrogenase
VVMAVKNVAVADVQAAGTKDHAEAVLAFADGTAAHLTASRVTQGRTRDLALELMDGAIYALDYFERTLTRDGAALAVTGDANNLGRQMTSFARAVRTGRAPEIGADDALAVMNVVWQVQRALGII